MIRKTLTYSSFLIETFLIILVFITAKTYVQLGVAIVLYPILAYYALRLFPRKALNEPIISINMAKQPRVRSEKEEFKHKQIEVVDIDKRAFLKLIGAAGVYFFLSSLFSRRGETLFFDRIANQDGNPLENSTGNQTYPVVRQPTDGYQISEIDDGDITFLGYTNQTGNWYIMKGDPETGSYRYTKGESDFARSWNNRKNLHYVYFYELFAAR